MRTQHAPHDPEIRWTGDAWITLALPLRNSIQAVIDRRFYREKYAAQKILEAFAVWLQSQSETNEVMLAEEVSGVIQETLQPEHVRVWLIDNGAPKAGK